MQRTPRSAPARKQEQPPAWRRTAGNVGIATLLVTVVAAGGVAVAQNRDAGQQAAQAADGYTSPVSYTPPPKPTTVAFLGDAHTEGAGTSMKFNRWSTLVANENKWLELNYGVGGTNFANEGPVYRGKSYPDRLTDLVISQPDIVIVSSGGNELEVNQEQGIRSTFQTLRQELPDARIVALSPFRSDEHQPEEWDDFGDDIRDGVEEVDGDYIDIGNPIEDEPDLQSREQPYPNDLGHAEIAEIVADGLG